MKSKTELAQSYIEGTMVARMQIEFGREFSDTYDIPNLGMMGVGPMQSFLGWAIKEGYIELKHDPKQGKKVVPKTKWGIFW
jgi:hypothetical protein